MAPAVFDQTTIDFVIGKYTFRSTGSVLKFAGFTRVYEEGKDDAAAAPDEALTDGKKPLAETFGLPVHAVGVGEQAGDLRPFDAAEFALGLVGL